MERTCTPWGAAPASLTAVGLLGEVQRVMKSVPVVLLRRAGAQSLKKLIMLLRSLLNAAFTFSNLNHGGLAANKSYSSPLERNN